MRSNRAKSAAATWPPRVFKCYRHTLTRNSGPVERTLQVLADVRAGGSFDLATLSVAVREIRNLIDATEG